MINLRPITYIGRSDDPLPLTPNNCLQTKFETEDLNLSPAATDSISRKTLLAFSRQAEDLLNVFWRTWSTTYLQELRERHWHNATHFRKNTSTQRLEVGDVVILRESLKKRNILSLIHISEPTRPY